MSANPYQAPLDASTLSEHLAGQKAGTESARSVFLAWEALRLVYNGLLAIIVLACAASSLSNWDFWELLATGVFGANVCFCVGPILEGYVALLGAPRRVVRWLIFVPGMLFACAATLGLLYVWNMGGFKQPAGMG